MLTPIAAPIANCYAESWIAHLKAECLNLLFCFSLRQLDHVCQTYAEYHKEYGPHQALGNWSLGADEPPTQGDHVEPGAVGRRRAARRVAEPLLPTSCLKCEHRSMASRSVEAMP